jgi:hypothetical protein
MRGHYIILIAKQVIRGENRWHPLNFSLKSGGCRGVMVVEFTTTYAINAYHH